MIWYKFTALGTFSVDHWCKCFSFGLRTTKGVLLHGPPGTGKTSLARLCVIDAGVNLFSVNGPEIFSQYYGESEQAMHKVFDSACQSAPAVVRFFSLFFSNLLRSPPASNLVSIE
jgi:SpoVK/Ycf46/Vps4 family AAA+-type ATPase